MFVVVLDEVGCKDSTNQTSNNEEPTLKTRSLPAWVRSKPRPLSTEDDLNDLYAKVSYTRNVWMICSHFFCRSILVKNEKTACATTKLPL